MRFSALIVAALMMSLAGIAVAQSPVFKQRIEHMQIIGVVDTSDGGVTTTLSCFQREGLTRDGGSWPLKFDTFGPITGAGNPSLVIRDCGRGLQQANNMDGGD